MRSLLAHGKIPEPESLAWARDRLYRLRREIVKIDASTAGAEVKVDSKVEKP